jgi:hypothetical protein
MLYNLIEVHYYYPHQKLTRTIFRHIRMQRKRRPESWSIVRVRLFYPSGSRWIFRVRAWASLPPTRDDRVHLSLLALGTFAEKWAKLSVVFAIQHVLGFSEGSRGSEHLNISKLLHYRYRLWSIHESNSQYVIELGIDQFYVVYAAM